MTSEVLQEKVGLGPGLWKCWRSFQPEAAPSSPGLYFLRLANSSPIERVKGASDIVYIGSTRDIRKRLKAHANPDWNNFRDSGWLISLIAQHRNLEVGWKEQPLPIARHSESSLLTDFVKEHCELPPANRQMPDFSQEDRATIMLLSLAPDQRKRLLREGQPKVPPAEGTT